MPVVTAASPGLDSGNLRKRIALLRQAQQECTISGVPLSDFGPMTLERYLHYIVEQIEWLNDELSVNEAQLQLALFPPLTTA